MDGPERWSSPKGRRRGDGSGLLPSLLALVPLRRAPSWRLGLPILLLVMALGMLFNVCLPAGGLLPGSGGPRGVAWRAHVRVTTEGGGGGGGARGAAGRHRRIPAFRRQHLVVNISELSCSDAVDEAIYEAWDAGGAALAAAQPGPANAFRRCAQPRRGEGVGHLRHVLTLRSGRPREKRAVTLLSHLSLARLPMLENQCRLWHGPLAAAVYMPLVRGRMYLNDTASGNPWAEGNPWGSMAELTAALNGSRLAAGARLLAAFHARMEAAPPGGCALDVTFMVEERCNAYLAGLYPINAARNRAIALARTEALALVDVDFVPSRSLSEGLGETELGYDWLISTLRARKAVVLPAFQTNNRNGLLKTGIRQALRAAEEGKPTVLAYAANATLVSFEFHEYGRGHRATNYSHWARTAQPYPVKYTKVIHTFHMAHLGVDFVAHPTAFVVHVPHPRAVNQAITADTGLREVLGQRYIAAKKDIYLGRYRPTVSLPELCILLRLHPGHAGKGSLRFKALLASMSGPQSAPASDRLAGGMTVGAGEFMKTWRRRWFVLKEGKIFWFKDDLVGPQSEPRGIIEVNRCLSIKGAEDTINKPHAFEISTTDASMFFIADSDKEKEDWINAVGRAIVRHSKSIMERDQVDYTSTF
eukprot:scaffold3.g6440.t1